MPAYDFRTKDGSQWSYYVVDNLVTMANIYRYDTAQEAIDKYKSLPSYLRSAIGSSIGQTLGQRHEIDHIHRVDGKSVLVRDMDIMTLPLWRDSQEIAEAVALMRSQLRVRHEKTSLFRSSYGSVAIPISDPNMHDTYSTKKKLYPREDADVLSCINEVHVQGKGWIDMSTFRWDLDHRPWSPESGYPVPFVDMLNVRYKEDRGYVGQIDITPAQFKYMCEELNKAQTRKPGLDEKIGNAEAKTPRPIDRDNSSHDKTR